MFDPVQITLYDSYTRVYPTSFASKIFTEKLMKRNQTFQGKRCIPSFTIWTHFDYSMRRKKQWPTAEHCKEKTKRRTRTIWYNEKQSTDKGTLATHILICDSILYKVQHINQPLKTSSLWHILSIRYMGGGGAKENKLGTLYIFVRISEYSKY
jgi:hypothetical protein